MLANTIWAMQYSPSKSDPDVWLRPAVMPDRREYYEMILCYVDDVVSISHKPMDGNEGIKKTFTMKGDKAEGTWQWLRLHQGRGVGCYPQRCMARQL